MGIRQFTCLVGACLTFAACQKQVAVPPPDGSREGHVTVQYIGFVGDTTVDLSGVEVFFYPFDRDSLFDALDAQASTPKPTLPEGMLTAFGQIRALQDEWWEVEGEWTRVRDEMRDLADQMYGVDDSVRATPRYARRYERFLRLEAVEMELTEQKEIILDEFTFLQDSITPAVDAYRVQRDVWEEEAYASYFEIEKELLQKLGREFYADTTDAAGYVSQFLPDGDWWVEVHAPSPVGEYYWNVKIDPAAVHTLRLDESNGEERVRV